MFAELKFGKQLCLELISIPFELRVARIGIVIFEDELAGDEAQLKRILGRGSWRRRHRFSVLAVSGSRFAECPIKYLVEIDSLNQTGRLVIRHINPTSRHTRLLRLTYTH